MNSSKQHTFLISWEQDNSGGRHTIILKDLDVGQILYQYPSLDFEAIAELLITKKIQGSR